MGKIGGRGRIATSFGIFCCTFYLFQGFFFVLNSKSLYPKEKRKKKKIAQRPASPPSCRALCTEGLACQDHREKQKKEKKKETGSECGQRFECVKCAPMPIKTRQAEGLIETRGGV